MRIVGPRSSPSLRDSLAVFSRLGMSEFCFVRSPQDGGASLEHGISRGSRIRSMHLFVVFWDYVGQLCAASFVQKYCCLSLLQ